MRNYHHHAGLNRSRDGMLVDRNLLAFISESRKAYLIVTPESRVLPRQYHDLRCYEFLWAGYALGVNTRCEPIRVWLLVQPNETDHVNAIFWCSSPEAAGLRRGHASDGMVFNVINRRRDRFVPKFRPDLLNFASIVQSNIPDRVLSQLNTRVFGSIALQRWVSTGAAVKTARLEYDLAPELKADGEALKVTAGLLADHKAQYNPATRLWSLRPCSKAKQ